MHESRQDFGKWTQMTFIIVFCGFPINLGHDLSAEHMHLGGLASDLAMDATDRNETVSNKVTDAS